MKIYLYRDKAYVDQKPFKLHSEYQPTGDQPAAIAELVKGFQEGTFQPDASGNQSPVLIPIKKREALLSLRNASLFF